MSFSGALCEGSLIVDSTHDIDDLPTVKDVTFKNRNFETLRNVFQHCNELVNVKFVNCTVIDGNISYIFNDCRNLKFVDMSGLYFKEKPYSAGAFTHCYSLETMILPIYIRDLHLKFIPFKILKRVACGSSIEYTVQHFRISMKKDKQMYNLVRNDEGTFSTTEKVDRRVKQFQLPMSKPIRESKIFLIDGDNRKSFTEQVTINEYVDCVEVVVKNKDVMSFTGYIDIIVQ